MHKVGFVLQRRHVHGENNCFSTFMCVTQNVPDISPALNRLAWKLTPEQLGYFKFTCVRDPADRFVSNFNFLSVFDNALSADRDGSK